MFSLGERESERERERERGREREREGLMKVIFYKETERKTGCQREGQTRESQRETEDREKDL